MTVSELFQQARVRRCALPAIAAVTSIIVSACSTTPLSPYTEDTPPLILVPASQAGVEDQRGRFREIFCTILEARGQTLPDYRPCDDALKYPGLAGPASPTGWMLMKLHGITFASSDMTWSSRTWAPFRVAPRMHARSAMRL